MRGSNSSKLFFRPSNPLHHAPCRPMHPNASRIILTRFRLCPAPRNPIPESLTAAESCPYRRKIATSPAMVFWSIQRMNDGMSYR